ncbi:MAG: Arginine decarboxylase [Pelotomaculum sp. PtaB.Bin104]|nr:MAG: Arginine decarboxylase [Pelotomaculum sp. PtaB.Bin104]
MDNSQSWAPLYQALKNHAEKKAANFHIPGHRQGRGLPEDLASLGGQALFELDLTEIPGLDDLHNPQGVIARAQELAARACGAEQSFFLVNGTTVGVHALLIAAGGRGEVLLPRNAHRSVLGGLILSGADPVYVLPEIISSFGISAGVLPGRIRAAMEANPGIRAVLMVRPNYYGIVDDLAGQALVAHAQGRPVLVDEAHGAHLRFHRDLPDDAMSCGADAAVQSIHKSGGSLTQSSLLHLSGSLVNADAVAGVLSLLQTTSPSYLLMASLDLARRQLALLGADLLERALSQASRTRGRLARIKGLKVLSKSDLPGFDLDLTRLVVNVSGLGLTGYQVGELLYRRYNVYIEMAEANNIVACLSIGTTNADCDALVKALEDIACREKGTVPVMLPEVPVNFKKRMKPREAWFAAAQRVSLIESRGRVSAETVAVYPPGIPVLCPGEEINPEVYDYLVLVNKYGLPCQGASDPSLKTIKVVIE